jgi:tetratricopeptide (TPR) repeat protein
MELIRASLLLALAAGCVAVQTAEPKRLVIPEDMRRPVARGPRAAEPAPTASPGAKRSAADPYSFTQGAEEAHWGAADETRPARLAEVKQQAKAAAAAPAVPASQRYVLRLAEHGRVWEVELPESIGGYEVRIPMGSPVDLPTAADQELLGKEPAGAAPKSFLATLAKVSEMYAAHRYEMALIEVVDLEGHYPKESRILAMKGSLYQKLGKTQLARDAWKKALELDPADTAVAEALRGLKEE